MVKILLIGYMGAGKSAIAKNLSEKMNLKFIELDQEIENKLQKSISDIFSLNGEIYFRKQESKIFREMISKNESFILSLGGGTPCYANNHELLNSENVISIYLKASVKELILRLKNEISSRPILANLKSDELEEFINKHLFDRNFYYHQAKHIILTDGKTIDEISDQIISLVN